MPERDTLERAKEDKAEGKSKSTQAGEFVKEEMDHIRTGKHGAKSTKQAIAIGLSKARRAGVAIRPSKKQAPKARAQAKRDLDLGRRPKKKVSAKRSRAATQTLERAGKRAASKRALSRHAKKAARR